MKHTWLFIISLLCAIPLSGQIIPNIKVPELVNAVTINGMVGASEWTDASAATSISIFVEGDASDNISGTGQFKWDSTNFYALISVVDDSRRTDSSDGTATTLDSFDDDSAELYFDFRLDDLLEANRPTNISPISNTDGVTQYRFGVGTSGDADGEEIERTPNDATERPTGSIDYQRVNGSNANFIMEVLIPWGIMDDDASPFVASVGEVFGFNTAVNDDDDSGTREAQLFWQATGADAWENTDQWGAIELTAAIPEPSTVSLFFGMSGLAGWIVFKKRKKAA